MILHLIYNHILYTTMIYYKTDEQIELLRENCLLVSKVLTHIAGKIRPGLTGAQLDKEAEELIRDHGAVPGFKGLYGCPSTLLISINEQVVHGLPSTDPFKDGDIVSIDCGTLKHEYYGDAAYTFALGNISEEVMALLQTTKEALYRGIEQAKAGNRVGDISHAVQSYCEKTHNYGVVRELVGHGVGKKLHEKPNVPNFGKRGKGVVMKPGLVIAIEPMINMGRKEVKQLSDGWTIVTKDGKPSAHYEHTVAVRKEGADILSDHKIIEAAISKNKDLQEVIAREPINALLG